MKKTKDPGEEQLHMEIAPAAEDPVQQYSLEDILNEFRD